MATTYIDTLKMAQVQTAFGTVSSTLKVVNMALEAALVALKVSAFISFGATAWMERYIANIQPKVETLAKKTGEISQDIGKAIQMHNAASKSGDSI
jgi:hypothetical protein